MKALLIEGKTLGEATREALAGTTDPDVQATFVLLGDPSARAVATAALEVSQTPKPSASSGCSATRAGSGTLALLALGLWWAAARRRVQVPVRRP